MLLREEAVQGPVSWSIYVKSLHQFAASEKECIVGLTADESLRVESPVIIHADVLGLEADASTCYQNDLVRRVKGFGATAERAEVPREVG